MPRRHRATVLLALAALLGTEAPAAAEARPRDPGWSASRAHRTPAPPPAPTRAVRSLRLVAPPHRAELAAPPHRAEPAAPPHRAEDPWVARIEARLLRARAASADRQRASTPADADHRALHRRLARIIGRGRRGATVAVAVRDLTRGAAVFDWREHEALNPASNHKLVTAAAALELLGPDYRFETRVYRVDDTLYLVGEGDPTLQVSDLRALAGQIRASVQRSEIRHLVIDDSAFSSRHLGPGYDADGPGVSYMAPSGALSLQWNTVEITARGTTPGQPVAITVSPPSAHVTVRSSAVSGRGPISMQTRAEGTQTVVEVRGRLRPGARATERRRITDPGRFTASTFAALLGAPDATPLSISRGSTPSDARLVATHRSVPLRDVLRATLSYSNNFASEQLLRTLGWRMTAEPGDWTNGRLALRRYWQAAGLPLEQLQFENASGLSTRGRATARGLADLLAFATREGSDAAELGSVLPRAGREGTLRGRLRRSRGRVHAKTGTLRGASALSGVVRTAGGERLSFSILVEGPIGAARSRRLQDRLVMALVNQDRAG